MRKAKPWENRLTAPAQSYLKSSANAGLAWGTLVRGKYGLPFETSRKMEYLRNSLGKRNEWQFDDARDRAGTAHMPVCLCCGEDVALEQDYRSVLPFCSYVCRRDVASVGVQFA
jgi:hypothetical protein